MASINTSDHNQLQDNCSIYDDLESLLSEVQCLQELKMTTTVTKGVLSNIEIITKLEGEKRKALIELISHLKGKVCICM